MNKQPAWITLEDWAQQQLGERAPNMDTLRKWAREGLIVPAPEKIGRTWFVRPESRYYSMPKQQPAAHHLNLSASNEPPRGSRLIDRIRG